MKNITRNFEAKIQTFLIKKLVDFYNIHTAKIVMIEENPINSISYGQLSRNQSIPDAIIVEGGIRLWVELTEFSRNSNMLANSRKKIKYPDFNNQNRIECISLSLNLVQEQAAKAIYKKNRKDYSQFAAMSKTHPEGILVLFYSQEDPFNDKSNFYNLVEFLGDEHILESLSVGTGNFKEIILGSYVLNEGKNELIFEVVADAEIIKRIRNRAVRKKLVTNLLAQEQQKAN